MQKKKEKREVQLRCSDYFTLLLYIMLKRALKYHGR